MAQEVEIGNNGEGKIRSFWVGFGLSAITLSLYGLCWYYFVNDELKDIGQARDDQNLAQSSPGMSVTALLVGGYFIIPPLLSVYNYGQRIKRAQRLTGVPRGDQVNPITAFLLFFPGALLNRAVLHSLLVRDQAPEHGGACGWRVALRRRGGDAEPD